MDVLTLNFWVQHFQKIDLRKGKHVQFDGCPSGSQFNRTVHIKYHKEFVHIYYCFVGFIR